MVDMESDSKDTGGSVEVLSGLGIEAFRAICCRGR